MPAVRVASSLTIGATVGDDSRRNLALATAPGPPVHSMFEISWPNSQPRNPDGRNRRNFPPDPHGRPDADRCDAVADHDHDHNHGSHGSPTRCPGDTLALGVVLLLASTVLQRAVGFAREICFCRWLSPEQLGQWDMAFGFLMLAGPLLVMSLPGTFGRYVDRYRQAGQLRSFLRRTAGFCAALSRAVAAGDPGLPRLVLLPGLRQPRP